jgi:two-component system, OmpR family, KDP operon response regulator KdpE
MSPPHILVIDDEVQLRRMLTMSLRERGYQVTAVATGQEGLVVAAAAAPAVIILDLGLPDMDGLAVCRDLRGWTTVPILVLSARYEEMEKVRALDLGADDYLTKPFGVHELLARIRVALRHTRSDHGRPVIETGDLRIDLVQRRVSRQAVDVHLTPTEYDLLVALASHAGKVLTHTWLLTQVWGSGYADNIQTLHVFISQLRRKIEPDPARPAYIQTEPGVGYRFRSG